jgi:predicted SprT family Zn-dependent metalloprotease
MENNNMIKATPLWMKENYNRFNQELFDGELGDCEFKIFTTGRGSQGKTLGMFQLTGSNLYANRYSDFGNPYARRMYVIKLGEKQYIYNDNFVEECRPVISLNGHYSGEESSLQATLVHEMCHYRDYMDGYCPKQGHGPRFREIAQEVSQRSNGMFTIQRVASAETMLGYKLDDEMVQKRKQRAENRISNSTAIVVFCETGETRLSIVSSNNKSLISEIYGSYKYGYNKGTAIEILMSDDPQLIQKLQILGFRKILRTHRYWPIKTPVVGEMIRSYPHRYLMTPEEAKKIRIDMGIEKRESKVTIGDIVESVINEYVNEIENDNAIPVTGLDLGAESPFEYAGINQ